MSVMLATVVRWALATGAPDSFLSDPEARRLFEEAKAAFADENYASASDLLERAYLVEPAPALLYPWAQAERALGRCDVAIDLYERFVETTDNAVTAEYARENIERCKEELAEQGSVTEIEETEEVSEPPEEPPVAGSGSGADEGPNHRSGASDRLRPWYADPTGGALMGVGIAALVTGGALVGVASRRAGSLADEADDYGDYLDGRDDATLQRNLGLVAIGLAGGLVIGGIVRYAVVAKRTRGTTARARPRVTVPGVWAFR